MSINILTFIIPVRHPENTADWYLLKQRLRETAASISQQDHNGWKAIVVANYGADLPELPPKFEIKRVGFLPNKLYRQGNSEKEAFYNACRIDKGNRILAGILHAGVTGYIMIVDDDDFISCRLASFVSNNPQSNGWYLNHGYIWSGGKLLYSYEDFSQLCGTSHIIRADLYNIPNNYENADSEYISRTLGSHMYIREDLRIHGTPLTALPFHGAVYRTGHSGAHSVSRGILREYFIRKFLLYRPLEFYHRLKRLKFKNNYINKEFFGCQ